MASLVVVCKCGTKLAAPESAVGKQIRCPKCGALATVPALVAAEEVAVVEAKVADPPKPKPKPVRAEASDDDDDDRPRKKSRREEKDEDEDDEERPRKKKKKRYAADDDSYDHDRKRKPKPKKSGGALVAGLIVGGLLFVCAGIAVAVYAFGGKGGVFAKRAPVPAGWEEHKYPQDGFRLYAPKGTSYTPVPINDFVGGLGGRPRFNGRQWDWENNLPAVERYATLNTTDWNAPAQVAVHVIRFRDRVPTSARDAVRRMPNNAALGGVEMRSVKWLGYDAIEQVGTNAVTRMVYTDRHLVSATISGPNMTRARTEEEAAFFDNFEITD